MAASASSRWPPSRTRPEGAGRRAIAIYEDFLGFSYGFRPKRSQHDVMDAFVVGISSRNMNYVLDADIRSFSDMRAKLREEMRRRRHQPIPEQGNG